MAHLWLHGALEKNTAESESPFLHPTQVFIPPFSSPYSQPMFNFGQTQMTLLFVLSLLTAVTSCCWSAALVAEFGGGGKGTFLVRQRSTDADKRACIITLAVPGSITHHLAKPTSSGVWEVNGKEYGSPRSLEEVGDDSHAAGVIEYACSRAGRSKPVSRQPNFCFPWMIIPSAAI